MSQRLIDLLEGKRIIICVGSGGVGKTTIAAALALQAAMEGHKTLALTIDPAKRLANSLGLTELENRETRIEEKVFQRAGLRPKGELFGMMLDVKRTFDELIRRITPTEEAADKILDNHYYQSLSDALAGSQEYMAMEKLFELQAERDYEKLVVDTPPTQQALDFLEAPKRMADFLDGRVIQWFIKPYLLAGKVGFAFAQRSATLVFKMLERATGYEAMADLADFFLAFDGMYDGFKQRAGQVKRLLGDDSTAFILVTSPASSALGETEIFYKRLQQERMTPAAIVFNRVHDWTIAADFEAAVKIRTAAERVMARFSQYAPAIDGLVENALEMSEMAAADESAMARFVRRIDRTPIYRVPALAEDVHDLAALMIISGYLNGNN